MRTTFCAALLLVSLAACGGGDGDDGSASADEKTDVTPSETLTTPEPSPTVTESAAPPINTQGNAATNPACQLLTVDQVASAAGLDVIGILGLEAPAGSGPHLESCTWYLDPKFVQSSLVVQYMVHAERPADLLAYYPQVIAQGFGKEVPKLGEISKIQGFVLDTIYKRAEIHVSLLTHAKATAEDQAATIGLMRLVMPGIKQ